MDNQKLLRNVPILGFKNWIIADPRCAYCIIERRFDAIYYYGTKSSNSA